MTLSTLRPNGGSLGSNWAVTGAASIQAATNDNSDASTVDSSGGTAATCSVTFPTLTLPALGIVTSITPRYRFLHLATPSGQQGFRAALVGETISASGPDYIKGTTSLATYTGTSRATRPAGGVWTQADLNALSLSFNSVWGASWVNTKVAEIYLDVLYNEAPVATVSAPTGTITTTAQPTVTMTYSDPESDPKERHVVKVFSAAQYGIGGFDPETSPSTWSSGEVLTAALTQLVGLALQAGTYKAYAKVADVGSSGRYGAWAAGPAFTIQVDPPGQPVIDVVADSLLARLAIAVQGLDNLLSVNQASLETDTTGWYANGGCTIARSTAQFLNGAASLSLTATGTTTMSARTADTTNGGTIIATAAPVVAGRLYTAMASFRAAATARTVQLQMAFYTAAGAFVSTITGLSVQDNTAGWTQAYASGVAPPTAAFVILIPVVLAPVVAAEVHYVDAIGISPVPVRNMLTPNQASFEVDTTGWQSEFNCTIARSIAQALDGAASLALTATATGGMGARTTGGVAGTPVIPGQSYTAVGWVRANTTVQSCHMNIRWFTAAGATVTDSSGASSADVNTGWSMKTLTATAPATAAFASAYLVIDGTSAIGEVHYIDRVRLFVSSINLLTPQQASIEAAIGTEFKVYGTNTTIARSTAQFLDVAGSLALTSVAAGDMMAGTPDTATPGRIPIVGGTQYTAQVWSKAATSIRVQFARVSWYDAAGAFLSTSDGSSANNSTTVWTPFTVTATAPATAVGAIIALYVQSTGGAGEVHYADTWTFARTADLTWLAGGRAAGAVVIVERSLDGGATWTTVRGGAAATWPSIADQQLTLYDYEVARGVPALYRARVVATVGSLVATSPNGQAAVAVAHAATGWWLKDLVAPALNMQLDVQPGFKFSRKEPQQVYDPLGRSVSVSVTDGVKGIVSSLEVWTKSKARYDKLETIIGGARPLWLEDVLGRAWYIKVSDATEWAMLRATPDIGETTPVRHFHSVTLPFVQVGSPSGDVVAAGTPTG